MVQFILFSELYLKRNDSLLKAKIKFPLSSSLFIVVFHYKLSRAEGSKGELLFKRCLFVLDEHIF